MNPDLLRGATIVQWCSACSSAQAITEIEVEMDAEWVKWPVCQDCLTRLEDAGRIDS